MPAKEISGRVGRLVHASNPLRYDELAAMIELRGVRAEGGVFGQHLIPERGEVAGVRIAGKEIVVRDGTIRNGCIDVRGLGQVILMFTGGRSPVATLVLTPAQIDSLP